MVPATAVSQARRLRPGKEKGLVHGPHYEWWRQDLNSGSLFAENLDPGHCFAILAHRSLPLPSRSAIGTLTWRSVFGGTSEGLTRCCQTCSSCWGPWRTARRRSARRSWRRCRARWVSWASQSWVGRVLQPAGGQCGHCPDVDMDTALTSDFHRPVERWGALEGWGGHANVIHEDRGL